MLNNLSIATKLLGALVVVVLIIVIALISISGNQVSTPPVRYLNDNASADDKVEALKTMTADLLIVQAKNHELEKKIDVLQLQNQKIEAGLKHSINEEVQSALQKMQEGVRRNQQEFKIELQQKNTNEYPVHTADNSMKKFIWVSNLSKQSEKDISGKSKFSLNRLSSFSRTTQKNKKKSIWPVYTIPVNATLTGATLMTPLVGRVPINDNLPSPYKFKLVLSEHNLTANGFPMPGVKGAVLSGIASGDMLGSCARGDIHSITFVFNDGTISTVESNGNGRSLGYISSQTGDPCITGTFHSNAGIFLGAQMGLAGAEGYANALSQSQYMNSVTPNGSVSSLIGNANEAALGKGGGAAAQAAETWWNQRVQNSFDYVYVSNVDSATGRPMKVVVNITQQIPINYNPNGRKVSYENTLQDINDELD